MDSFISSWRPGAQGLPRVTQLEAGLHIEFETQASAVIRNAGAYHSQLQLLHEKCFLLKTCVAEVVQIKWVSGRKPDNTEVKVACTDQTIES